MLGRGEMGGVEWKQFEEFTEGTSRREQNTLLRRVPYGKVRGRCKSVVCLAWCSTCSQNGAGNNKAMRGFYVVKGAPF